MAARRKYLPVRFLCIGGTVYGMRRLEAETNIVKCDILWSCLVRRFFRQVAAGLNYGYRLASLLLSWFKMYSFADCYMQMQNAGATEWAESLQSDSKHSDSATLHQAAILNFIGSQISG